VWVAYALVAVNIPDASSVSTSALDLFSVASLTIAVATSIDVNFNARKSSGATNDVGVGCKINSTIVGEAVAAGGMGWRCSTFDIAQSGSSHYWIHSRSSTSYLTASGGEYNAFTQATGGNRAAGQVTNLNGDGIFPNAEITDLVQRAITDSASNTVAADDLQVYTKTVA